MNINTLYSKSARFDTGRALTEDELFRVAPSIFADEARPDVTSRHFAPIPTINILRALTAEGFHPVGARQTGVGAYSKHLVRLRRLSEARKYAVGDTVCEVLLKNANDGTSLYELFAGLFRITCLNSMVTCTGTVDMVKVRHSGDVYENVVRGTYTLLDQAVLALEAPTKWSTQQLSDATRLDFARVSHTLRFSDTPDTPFEPADLLKPRRTEDDKRDLWTTFNIVQENCIAGGLTTYDARARRRLMKPITNIDKDVQLNRALWQLAEGIAA